MAPKLLTKVEGISITLIGILFAVAGAWAFWRVHPVLAVVLTGFLIWMLAIYHHKVCVRCPHTNCPANPAFWANGERRNGEGSDPLKTGL